MGSPWQLRQIDETRAAVARRLDEIMARGGVELRLAACLEAIVEGERAFNPEAQLLRLVHVIAALAHHARWGGLSDRDATQLASLGEAILTAHGVDKGTSTLSVLWGELLVAKSQVMRLAGKTWESLWEQHLSHQASRRQPVGTPAFHALAAGLRAARLGMLDVAHDALLAADTQELPERNREQARLARVQCLRLAGRTDEAREALKATRPGLSPVASRDAAWEDLVQRGDCGALAAAVGPRGDHRAGTFLLEAFLATRAQQSRQHEERLPGLRTIRKLSGDVVGRSLAFRACFDTCAAIDDAYDADRPLTHRIKALGEMLRDTHLLPSLDKELLARAAAFRWLLRAKQLEFAAFVFADYEMRCRQLSGGRCADVLGVMSDVDRTALLASYTAPSLRSAS